MLYASILHCSIAELTLAQDLVTHQDAFLNPKSSNIVTQSMSKKRSSQSRHGPFIDTETAVPPLTLNTWRASHDEPFSGFAPTSTSTPAFKTRKTSTGRIPAQTSDYSSISVYEPAEYVKQSQSTLSPISPRHARSRRNSSQNLSPSSFLSQSPSTSTSDGFTNPTTLSSIGMSRTDSLSRSSFCKGLDMLRVNSQIHEAMLQPKLQAQDGLYHSHATPPSSGASAETTHVPVSLSHTGTMIDETSLAPMPPLLKTSSSTLDCDQVLAI